MRYSQKVLILPKSIWSWAARRARSRALLERVAALLTRVTAGRSSCASFASLGPDGCWRKTYRGYCQLTLDGSLETFSGSWPKQGTMRAGRCTELAMSERRTGEIGSLLWPAVTTDTAARQKRYAQGGAPMSMTATEQWPTPTTPNGGRTLHHVDAWSGRSAYHKGKKVQVDLAQAVRLWPTPDTNNHRDGTKRRKEAKGSHAVSLHHAICEETWPTVNGNHNRVGSSKHSGDGLATAVSWPTPRTSDANGVGVHGESGMDLRTAVNWNTPRAYDAKNACLPRNQEKRDTLLGDLIREGTQGSLNPDWVETLMGFSPGWTKLPPGWRHSGGRRGGASASTRGSRRE